MEEKAMTVLVCSSKGSKKSFVLSFQNGISANEVKHILRLNPQETAVRMLISRSTGVMAVRPESRRTIEHIADFVIGDSYTTERLA